MDNFYFESDVLHNRIGLAADHGGFELKQFIMKRLSEFGYEVKDYGNISFEPTDDYTDYVLPLAKAIQAKEVGRAIAICGSGVGVTIAANKVNGVRACLIHDTFSAHQGVEDDDLNMICLGGLVIGNSFAWELVSTFLSARFNGNERYLRRLEKIKKIEGV